MFPGEATYERLKKKCLPLRAKPAFQPSWALCAVTSPLSTSGFPATQDGHLIYNAWIHRSPRFLTFFAQNAQLSIKHSYVILFICLQLV